MDITVGWNAVLYPDFATKNPIDDQTIIIVIVQSLTALVYTMLQSCNKFCHKTFLEISMSNFLSEVAITNVWT